MWALVILWVGLALAAEPDCAEARPEARLMGAENQIALMYLQTGLQELDDAVAAWGCGKPATNADLARLWAGYGVVTALQASLDGKEDAAKARVDSYLAAAVALQPGTFPDTYGEDFQKRALALPAPSGAGGLAPAGLPANATLLVDGKPWSKGAALTPGWHLVQVTAPGTAAKVVEVTAGAPTEVSFPSLRGVAAAAPTPLPTPAPVDSVAPVQPARKGPRWALTAPGLGAVGLGAVALAVGQFVLRPGLKADAEAGQITDPQAALLPVNATIGAGYGLVAVGAALTVTGVVVGVNADAHGGALQLGGTF